MYALITIGSGVEFSTHAYLIVLDLNTGYILEEFKYRHQVYDRSTKGFTGAVIAADNTLWVTTEAEVLHFRLNPLRIIKRVTKPIFNDLHFVFADSDRSRILICNTGLDSVEEFDFGFNYIRTIRLVQGSKYFGQAAKVIMGAKPRRKLRDLWLKLKRKTSPQNEKLWAEDRRYKHLTESIFLTDITKILFPSRLYHSDIDLRYVLFRPHILHPNHIWKIGEQYLVTLKNTGEVITLKERQTVLADLDSPHDGILRESTYMITQSGSGSLSYINSVDAVCDLKRQQLQHVQVCDPKEGFLRGVDLLSDKLAVVAVSKRREISDDRPAYLSLIDLERNQLIGETNIPQKYGTNPFSIIDVTSYY